MAFEVSIVQIQAFFEISLWSSVSAKELEVRLPYNHEQKD